MTKYGKRRRQKAERTSRKSADISDITSAYQPPDRDGCEKQEYSHIQDGYPIILLVIRTWRQDGQMVDFHAVAWESDDNGTPIRKLASVDCKNHGTIHLHDETPPSRHKVRTDLRPIRSAHDIEQWFEQSLDELIDYAGTVATRGWKR